MYPRTVRKLIGQGDIALTDSIVVIAAGEFDRQVMHESGLTNVVISNLAHHVGQAEYSPFHWLRIDAEDVALEDNSCDWAVVHAGLHHLAVPAKGVCEMLRIARKGILCFEARDSLLMRAAVRAGLTSEYELEPALLTDGESGGYRNGPIPNYVYRWTEREFEKVVNCYLPTHRHEFFYEYGFNVPLKRFAMARSPLYRAAGTIADKVGRFAELVIPTQGNQFAFGVRKCKMRQPWLTQDLKFDASFVERRYDKDKYSDDRA